MQEITGGLSPTAKCACQMCDRGVDETVVHVILVCGRYWRERTEMLRLVVSEMGWDVKDRIVGTGREWMLLLLLLAGTGEKGRRW